MTKDKTKELDQLYTQLRVELLPYLGTFKKATATIRDENVSKYPIMVIHQHELEVGIPIVDREEVKGNWSVNASTLEEFVSKNIMEKEKVDEFIKVYGENKDNYCLFVLSELGANFIYIPV